MFERFWVFAWELNSEPHGGMRDFHRSFKTVEAAGAYLAGYLVGQSLADGYVWDSELKKEIHPTTYSKGVSL